MDRRSNNSTVSDNNNWTKIQRSKKINQKTTQKTDRTTRPIEKTIPAPTKRVQITPKNEYKDAPSTPSTKTIVSETIKSFEELDDRFNTMEVEKAVSQLMLKDPLTDSELEDALIFVSELLRLPRDDWYVITEAENYVLDKRRIAKGLKPIFSIHVCGYIAVNQPIDISSLQQEQNLEDGSNMMLPNPIALVCEWQDQVTKAWKSINICVMKTIADFWTHINALSLKFSMPMLGREDDANKIFKQLMNPVSNRNADINNNVSEFNSFHPVWSFIKVKKTVTKDNSIVVPFIRQKGRALNDITINLKDTEANRSLGIHPLGDDFTYGYIPLLILDLVGAGDNIPEEIISVVFSRTIAVNGTMLFRGYRVRVLTKDITSLCLKKCEKFIREDFVREINKFEKGLDYSKCVARISLPKVD